MSCCVYSRTCPPVPRAGQTVGHRGKTRFEMSGARSSSVEKSSKSFSISYER